MTPFVEYMGSTKPLIKLPRSLKKSLTDYTGKKTCPKLGGLNTVCGMILTADNNA